LFLRHRIIRRVASTFLLVALSVPATAGAAAAKPYCVNIDDRNIACI